MHKFIKIKGPDSIHTGYFVPRLYYIGWSWSAIKIFGIPYIKDRLSG